MGSRRCRHPGGAIVCGGAPTAGDVVDLVDQHLRSAARRTWQQSLAYSARWAARTPVTPRRVPGRCTRITDSTMRSERAAAVLCPNAATTTDRYGRALCDGCAAFTAKLIEHSERSEAQMRAAFARRRRGLPEAKPRRDCDGGGQSMFDP